VGEGQVCACSAASASWIHGHSTAGSEDHMIA
jgi:hypothetical protein